MKKLLIISILSFAAFSIKAQTIDTTFKTMAACKISPFKAKFVDTSNVTRLGIRIVSDDLKSSCTLYWVLFFADGTQSVEGNDTISGASYTNWNGSNIYPFTFIGLKYSITFL